VVHEYIHIGRDFRCRQISLPTKSDKMAAGSHLEYTKMAINLLPAFRSMRCFSLAWADGLSRNGRFNGESFMVKLLVSKILDGSRHLSWVHSYTKIVMTLQPIDAMFGYTELEFIIIQPEILCKPDNKTTNIYVKDYRFKHACNDDAGIERRKLQKLVHRISHVNFQSRRYNVMQLIMTL